MFFSDFPLRNIYIIYKPSILGISHDYGNPQRPQPMAWRASGWSHIASTWTSASGIVWPALTPGFTVTSTKCSIFRAMKRGLEWLGMWDCCVFQLQIVTVISCVDHNKSPSFCWFRGLPGLHSKFQVLPCHQDLCSLQHLQFSRQKDIELEDVFQAWVAFRMSQSKMASRQDKWKQGKLN